MILVTVVYKTGPVTVGARNDYAESMDAEAKHDAERCKQALEKRFPRGFFLTKRRKLGSWTVEVQELEAVESLQAKMFAEGFMASAWLWER